MAAEMEFSLLGPLRVRRSEAVVTVPAGRQRALLAALLLNAGQVVSVTELADVLWGAAPPASAPVSVRNHVKRVRRVLGDAGRQRISTHPHGYMMSVGPGELDLELFESLVATAQEEARAGLWEAAARRLAQALLLWRGQPLADVDSDLLALRYVPRLVELRLLAIETRIDADLHLGRQAGVIAELRGLVGAHPLRERLYAMLMLACYRDGRQAEALTAYQHARSVLAEELGSEPGAGLRELHQRILTADPALAMTEHCGLTPGAPWPTVPRQLPARPAHFVGRAGELAALTGLLDRASGQTAMISAIDGMPGVGKTALAVQAGHQVADRFPDRQLFVELHGHTPGRAPSDPAALLGRLLTADGVNPRYLPSDLDGRAAMWRDRLAGQRVLLILDDAASSGQVAPLLPGSAKCLVLVTSRRVLGDLPSVVLRVPLDVPPPSEAAALFTGLASRAAGEPALVAEMVALCGYLPLAITLLARLFTRHRSWGMADLIAESQERLLTITAETRTIATAFDLSYQDLDAGRRRFFRYLGLHPGADIDAYAASALAGLPLNQAAAHLDALHGGRLLDEPAPGRYRMHDLIRQYARSLAIGEPGPDSARERERATGRLLDYYQHTAQAAGAHLARHARPPVASLVPAPAAAPRLPGPEEAHAWMTAERANLVACIGDAAERHDHARVVGLTGAIASHLRSDGPWPQAIALHTVAARVARGLGDQPGQACALLNLGDVQRATGDYRGAADVLMQALGIYRGLGSRLGEASALRQLGAVREVTGDYRGAADVLAQALGIYRGLGSRLGEASALLSLGDVQRATGDYQGAADVLMQALGIYRGLGSQLGEASALRSLGTVRQMTGDYPGAMDMLEQSLGIWRGIGDLLGQAEALNQMGTTHLSRGDPLPARTCHQHALELARSIGSPLEEARALKGIGKAARVIRPGDGADGMLAQALAIYRRIGVVNVSRLAADMIDSR